MNYPYKELYKIFNEELIKESGIDYYDAEKLYLEIGNSPGIYPDSLLLLIKMIKKIPIKKIVEIGSGFSTLYFTKICDELNIQFTSYEEKYKFLNKTRILLYKHNLKQDIIIKNNLFKLNNINDINYNTDLLFIDCSNELRKEIIESNNIYNIPIIIVDDCERKELSKSCSIFICKTKRYNFYVYNGVGRKDRHLFINTTFDIKDFINKEIPCLGN